MFSFLPCTVNLFSPDSGAWSHSFLSIWTYKPASAIFTCHLGSISHVPPWVKEADIWGSLRCLQRSWQKMLRHKSPLNNSNTDPACSARKKLLYKSCLVMTVQTASLFSPDQASFAQWTQSLMHIYIRMPLPNPFGYIFTRIWLSPMNTEKQEAKLSKYPKENQIAAEKTWKICMSRHSRSDSK